MSVISESVNAVLELKGYQILVAYLFSHDLITHDLLR